MISLGIIGSCVSRDIFEHLENCKLEYYFARTKVVSQFSPSLEIDESEVGLESKFQKKIVLEDANKTIFNQMKEKPVDWLILDYDDERLNCLVKGEFVITKSTEIVSSGIMPKFSEWEEKGYLFEGNKLFFQNVCIDFYLDKWLTEICRYVVPEHIILNKVYASDKYIAKDGTLCAFPKEVQESNKRINSIYRYFYKYTEKWLQKKNSGQKPYCIDLSRKYYASEDNKWGLKSIHYEKNLYFEAANMVSRIINAEVPNKQKQTALQIVLEENIHNFRRTIRLAYYETKAMNSDTWLGSLWDLLNPLLQIVVYWVVFSCGLNVSPPRDGFPYIIWMIVGITPWFFASAGLIGGAAAITSFAGVVKRMYIPLSIIPIKKTVSALISHFFSLIILFVFMLIYRIPLSRTCWQLPYYIFCLFFFLCGWSLLTSAISVVFKDFQRILSAFIRLLFYVTPIVWNSEQMSPLLRFNPLGYIINGYRNSLLYGISVSEYPWDSLYFWGFSIAMFIVGASVHMKFRRKFNDLI